MYIFLSNFPFVLMTLTFFFKTKFLFYYKLRLR